MFKFIVGAGLCFFAAPVAASWLGATGILGAASTGTAISSLHGAALTNAVLAKLGGGALAAGGFGMAGGTAVATTTGGLASSALLRSRRLSPEERLAQIVRERMA